MDVYKHRSEDWKDFSVSQEELKNITECLKEEEFRKLFIEYAEEVADPENRRLYERDITQLEKERGVDVTFVHPEPGYVIKTSVDGDRKCFLNISKSDVVARPSNQPSCEQGHRGLQWSIPYTLIPPRYDLDKKNVRCVVYDVVFHPDTIYLASKDARIREIVNNTAMDGVESNFKVKLDRKNLKFPKMSFKGLTHPTVIRKPSETPPAEPLDIDPEIYQKIMTSYDESRKGQLKRREEKPRRAAPATTYYKDTQPKPEDEKYVTPKISIKHQSNVELEDFVLGREAKMFATVPKNLVITIDLPLLRSAGDATLDIHRNSLTLKSEKPAKYLLDLPFPYSVDGNNGNAKFDPKYKKLTVTLPVVKPLVLISDNGRADNGVDSDQNDAVTPKDDEDLSNKKIVLVEECESACKSIEFDKASEVTDKCEDTALRTSSMTEIADAFMNPRVKYNLPAYTCNIYNNQLAIVINVKNANPDAIRHKILDNNVGIHILLTSVGAGFFPQYYSLCLKIGDSCIEPETLTIEPWDNNVVFSITVKDIENLTQYFVGVDTEFMEGKDLPTAASFTNKFKELMSFPEDKPQVERQISVQPQDDGVVINIRPNQQDSDDEEEHDEENTRVVKRRQEKKHVEKVRSVSESSGDELASNSSSSSARFSKGILKSRRARDFSRSMSESSADENSLSASCMDYPYDHDDHYDHYDSVHDINSESDCSSLKKTVRFNDVVSRQLFRSNSSILGQRKKNQRKLRNKKRAHDRRLSESENSETEERDKYKVDYKRSSSDDTSENVKPILARDKNLQQQRTANIEIAKSNTDDKQSSHKRKSSFEEKTTEDVQADASIKATKDAAQLEFKNDLIFDLDM